MLARVLTLRFDPVAGSFDDTPLRDFLKDKDVFTLREHFFVVHEVPYLVVLVTYALPPLRTPDSPDSETPSRTAPWRELVSEADLPLFNALRDWRLERSKQEGVPPYVICTNRQLAAMVQARPQSLAGLSGIPGFGKAKQHKYGQAMLALLSSGAPAQDRPPAAAVEDNDAPRTA